MCLCYLFYLYLLNLVEFKEMARVKRVMLWYWKTFLCYDLFSTDFFHLCCLILFHSQYGNHLNFIVHFFWIDQNNNKQKKLHKIAYWLVTAILFVNSLKTFLNLSLEDDCFLYLIFNSVYVFFVFNADDQNFYIK